MIWITWDDLDTFSSVSNLKVLQTADGSTSLAMLAQFENFDAKQNEICKIFPFEELEVWHFLSSICNLHSEVQPLAAYQPERFFGSKQGRALRDVVRKVSWLFGAQHNSQYWYGD